EALGEGTVLDLFEHFLHVFFDASIDDAWTGDVVTEFSGVGDRPALFGKATFDHEVNDELQFVQYFEVGNFWLVASFGEHFESSRNEVGCATAEDGLFTEQVGFGFFGEGGFDDTCTGSADTLGVCQGEVFSFAGFVFFHGDQGWDTAAGFEFTTDNVTWALWCDHGNVNTGWGFDVAVADVETVGEEQCVAFLQVRFNGFFEHLCLVLVWYQDHDDVSFFGCVSNGEYLQAFSFGFGLGFGAFGQADAYVDAGVAQGQRVGVALGAVADNSYFAVLQQRKVGIFVIVFLGHESVVLLGGICGWFIWSERGRSWICRRGQLRSCRNGRVRGCQRVRALPVALPVFVRNRWLLRSRRRWTHRRRWRGTVRQLGLPMRGWMHRSEP